MKHDSEKEQLLLEEGPSTSAPAPKISQPWYRPKFTPVWHAACIMSMLAFFLAGIGVASFWHRLNNNPLALSSDSSNTTGHWVASWTAAPQGVSVPRALPSNYFRENVSLSNDTFWSSWMVDTASPATLALENTTIRQTHRVSIGADEIRIRLSNAYSPVPLPIEKVVVAIPEPERQWQGPLSTSGSSQIRVDTLRTLTFAGRESITIPAHGLAVSDPLRFPIEANEAISLSFYLRHGQLTDTITCHLLSKSTTWLQKGGHTSNPNLRASGADKTVRWLVSSAVEAWKQPEYGALVTVGDSITDRGGPDYSNTDYRWPNFLSTRMQKSSDPTVRAISVVNQGLGGNRLMMDGKGPNLISRLDRDVLALSGVRYVMLLEGILDIGFAGRDRERQRINTERMKQQYQQIVTRLHAAGLPVFASTLTPISCERPNAGIAANAPEIETERLRINDWIMHEGPFDAVIDFDRALRDPKNHTTQNPAYISDDCIHPNPAGLEAMANAFPLDLFEMFKDGVDARHATG